MTIDSALDFAGIAVPSEDVLFGIEVIPAAVGGEIPDGTEIEVNTKSMFALMNERVSFRIQFNVTAGDIFQRLVIDVASNYDLPNKYEMTRNAFVEFANIVAAPHVRSYAQTVLNGILTEMKLPPRILPTIGGVGEEVFKGNRLPEVLSASVMKSLKSDPELSVED